MILSQGGMFESAPPEDTFHTPPGSNLSSNPSSSSVGGTPSFRSIVSVPSVLAVVLKATPPLIHLHRAAVQVPNHLPIGMAVFAFKQRLMAEREMTEGDH